MICARGLVYDAGMKRILPILIVVSGAALLALGQAPAQTAAVPVTGEPHHHLVYSDENVRAFDVEVPAHSSTMLHEHAVDYIWLALGDADVINAVAGKPEARLQIKDGEVHFTRGGFAHVARNESDSAFRNVTIELLKPQTNPQNICEEVIAATPISGGLRGDACGPNRTRNRLAFSTDQLTLALVQLAPREKVTVRGSTASTVLVAMDGTHAQAVMNITVAGGAQGNGTRDLHSGDVMGCPANIAIEIRNTGKTPARFLALEFNSPPR